MPKTDGYKTKKKILQVAEQLFAEKGFDGTSIAMIAKAAGVNKALIYYHFQDKNDIVISLFRSIVEEVEAHVDNSSKALDGQQRDLTDEKDLKEEITFLAKRKKILSVMLMESLKSDDAENFLFQCAELVINHELDEFMEHIKNRNSNHSPDRQRYMVYEFFTGVIPLFTFVALREKWCEYFKCDNDKLLEYFIDAFQRSHLASHVVKKF
jgi:AcrR family transcriptional regulator